MRRSCRGATFHWSLASFPDGQHDKPGKIAIVVARPVAPPAPAPALSLASADPVEVSCLLAPSGTVVKDTPSGRPAAGPDGLSLTTAPHSADFVD